MGYLKAEYDVFGGFSYDVIDFSGLTYRMPSVVNGERVIITSIEQTHPEDAHESRRRIMEGLD